VAGPRVRRSPSAALDVPLGPSFEHADVVARALEIVRRAIAEAAVLAAGATERRHQTERTDESKCVSHEDSFF
jgi:hypothetical protein